MKHVALVTCGTYPNLSESDKLLIKPLKQEGIIAHTVPWDERAIDWTLFDAVVLRSCWNYHKNYKNFLDWIQQIEILKIPMFNSPDIVRWNSHKSYMKDLQKKKVNAVPSIFLSQNTQQNIQRIMTMYGWQDIVIKPMVGGSSYEIFRVRKGGEARGQIQLDTLLQKMDCMIQPILSQVFNTGEYSFIFIDGNYSHTVQKIPKKGEYRTNYRFQPEESLLTPPKHLIQQASRIMDTIHTATLYARLDGINNNETLILMELELIEPRLYFDFYPKAASAFAYALKARLA